jgi:hypothetical protein
VQPQAKAHSGDLLVSLPGYRSQLQLWSGVGLQVWGNAPEQMSIPLLESAVVLHNPEPGIDLSFTLDRGRVVVSNRKASGPARVQVKFADQTWELTLAESQSEVGLDVIARVAGLDTEPLFWLSLLALKGPSQLRIGGQEFALQGPPGPAEFVWSRGTGPQGPRPVQEVPPWWTRTLPATALWQQLPPPEQENLKKSYESMNVALGELSKTLTGKTPLLVVLSEAMQSAQPKSRELAVLSLGAIDALPELLDALANEKFSDVRESAVAVLRHWLGRREGQEKKLREALLAKRYTTSQADIVLQLLHTFSPDDLSKKQTYEVLIEYLRHDNPAVRQLATWHLFRLVPEGRKIAYDPGAGVAQRKAGYEQWRKLLADGKIPPKPMGPQK